jgi:uncharacterized protein YlxW (UPF0749 family)
MTDEHRDTGTGWPETGPAGSEPPAARPRPASAARPGPPRRPKDQAPATSGGPARVPDPDGAPHPYDDEPAEPAAARPAAASPARRRMGSASIIIGLLLALLGFTLVVQLRGDSRNSDLAALREDDLVRLQSDLTAQEDRLQKEINDLEASQRQLQSGAEGRQAALAEATKRANELAILAGTVPATGPGIEVRMVGGRNPIKASDILNAVEELRGAGAEAMQIAGADNQVVRIVASTAFVDTDGGIQAGVNRLTGPYTLTVIGSARDMRVALEIPDGLVASIRNDGGNVTVDERDTVEVKALSAPVALEHARPES